MSAHQTRKQILSVATQLFAEQGIAATSVRQIVGEAGVNIAAVHYHFGSKDELVLETFRSFLREVNEERLNRLDALEREHPAGVPLRPLLDAMLRPAITYCTREDDGGKFASKLMGRMHTESDSELQIKIMSELEPVISRFMTAMHKTLPGHSSRDIAWSFLFTVGAMAFTLMQSGLSEKLKQLIGESDDAEELIARLLVFVEAGMKVSGAPQV